MAANDYGSSSMYGPSQPPTMYAKYPNKFAKDDTCPFRRRRIVWSLVLGSECSRYYRATSAPPVFIILFIYNNHNKFYWKLENN